MTRTHCLRGVLRAGGALTSAGCVSLLVACGGSGDEPSAASDSAARDTARVRLEGCLRKQGVDMERGAQSRSDQGGTATRTRPSEAELARMRKAMQGPCKKYQQKAFGDVSTEDRQEMRDRMVKFSACMRRHGVDMPDIKPGGGPQQVRINLNSPRARKAQEACQKLAPRPRGQGGGPGGGVMVGPAPSGSK